MSPHHQWKRHRLPFTFRLIFMCLLKTMESQNCNTVWPQIKLTIKLTIDFILAHFYTNQSEYLLLKSRCLFLSQCHISDHRQEKCLWLHSWEDAPLITCNFIKNNAVSQHFLHNLFSYITHTCHLDAKLHNQQIAPVPQRASLTQLLEESCADASQQGQSNQVSKAGSDGGGHVVWIDANLSGSDNHPDHDKPCFGTERDKLAVMVMRC